ncbi:MAG: hypothetical protein CO013_07270 [Syntrophobacterales bacterium CG_4_8_14_3_um_filter_58_8]|nr:MAG: hypothetical protein AUK26_13375 [Syntrophaceae bacterium CG2_30_58_14]PIV00088.1 MAG: hypothetical protein COS57_16450 [Syntrophobacterales bacterium CG03_land_8_20_14_0_80_58_14]PJC73244.1 MAG: hypothetical protein CO013_07270 [Syntrophobacterales bacterium CG_4_8_14_3_um_filter_58_8]
MAYPVMGKMKIPGRGGELERFPGGILARRWRACGFTLIELLISLAIGMVVLGAMYTVFTIQNRQFTNQEQIAEMQQIARTSMDQMVQEIAMAGFDPNRGATAIAGLTAISATSLTFTADLDENGVTTDTNENVTYAFDSANYRITRNTGGGAQPFAENIEDLTFTYYDAGGAETATIASIRRIKISIRARTARPDSLYTSNNGYRTYTLTSYVTPRNLPLG